MTGAAHRHGPACGCGGRPVVRLDAAGRRRAPRYPDAIEARVRAVLVDRVALFRRIVDDAFRPSLAALDDTAPRQDADDEAGLLRVVDRIRKTWGDAKPDARPALDRAGAQLDLFARDELADLVPTVFRIPVSNLPAQPAIVSDWRDKAWKFVQDADDAAVDRVATAVRTAVGRGLSTRTLQAEIERALGVSESRARLIARSETAKLNRQVSQARQTSIGIDRYEWSTSGDDKVRPSHRAKDGAIFRWDDPPSDTGHPGDDPHCRCVAIPVMDDLDAAAFGDDFAAGRLTPTATQVGDDGIVRPVDPSSLVETPGFGIANRRRWKREDVPRQVTPGAVVQAERERQAAALARLARGEPLVRDPAAQSPITFPGAVAAPIPSTSGPDPFVTRAVVEILGAAGLARGEARSLLAVLYRLRPDHASARRMVARGYLRADPTAPDGYALTTEGIAVVEQARHALAVAVADANRTNGPR